MSFDSDYTFHTLPGSGRIRMVRPKLLEYDHCLETAVVRDDHPRSSSLLADEILIRAHLPVTEQDRSFGLIWAKKPMSLDGDAAVCRAILDSDRRTRAD